MKFKHIFYKVIVFFTAFFGGYILYYALFTLNKRASFMNTYVKNEFLLHLIGGVLIAIIFMWVFHKINTVSRKTLKFILAALVLVILTGEAVITLNFQVVPTTDSYMICDAAMLLAKGKADVIGQGIDSVYFTVYTNNNFLVILLSLFFRLLLFFNITDIILPLNILNAFFINICILLSFLFVKEVGGVRNACKLLFVFAVSPVFYTSIPWSYSIVYSMPFQIGILYLALRIHRTLKAKNAVLLTGLLGIIFVIGYNIRPTTVIPMIAVLIFAVIDKIANRKKIKEFFLIFTVFLLSVFIAFTACRVTVNKYYDSKNSDQAYPITHWLMTGLHGDGTVSKEDNEFTQSFETTEEMRKANIEEIKKTLSEYGISGLVNHSGRKIRISWVDGSYNVSARLHSNSVYSPLYKYLAGEKKDFFLYYCQSFYVAVLMYVLIGLILRCRQKYDDFLFAIDLTLFGAIIFYIMWEGKESFSLPFVPLLYILAVQGASVKWSSLIDGKKEDAIKNGLPRVLSGILAVTVATMISQYSVYTTDTITRYERSIECSNVDYIRYVSETEELVQQFYTNIPFNTVELTAQTGEGNREGRYLLEISDDEKVYIREEISEEDIGSNGKIVLKFDRIEPDQRQCYTIHIKKISTSDSIQWGYITAAEMDNYEGTCLFDNVEQPHDLYIQVYNQYEQTYSSPGKYIVICIGILMVELLVLYFAKDLKKQKRI